VTATVESQKERVKDMIGIEVGEDYVEKCSCTIVYRS
jgi:hypothetical protein